MPSKTYLAHVAHANANAARRGLQPVPTFTKACRERTSGLRLVLRSGVILTALIFSSYANPVSHLFIWEDKRILKVNRICFSGHFPE